MALPLAPAGDFRPSNPLLRPSPNQGDRSTPGLCTSPVQSVLVIWVGSMDDEKRLQTFHMMAQRRFL